MNDIGHHLDEQNTERTFITYPTWKKYIVLSRVIGALRVKDKRHIFSIMRRTDELSHETFFPEYGFTAGEFTIWQILSDQRKARSRKSSTSAEPVQPESPF